MSSVLKAIELLIVSLQSTAATLRAEEAAAVATSQSPAEVITVRFDRETGQWGAVDPSNLSRVLRNVDEGTVLRDVTFRSEIVEEMILDCGVRKMGRPLVGVATGTVVPADAVPTMEDRFLFTPYAEPAGFYTATENRHGNLDRKEVLKTAKFLRLGTGRHARIAA